MKTPKRAILVAAGAAALLLAGSGATAAVLTIPSANGVIHSCYSSTGALRVVNATTCPSGQKTLSWNQKGAAGLPGPAGSLSNVDYGYIYERAVDGATPTCTLVQTGGPDHLTTTEGDLVGWQYYSGPTCEIDFPQGAIPVVTGVEGWSGSGAPWIHYSGSGIWISATPTQYPGANEATFMVIDP